jgi:tripartite ATP-independent transporter DctM subunit
MLWAIFGGFTLLLALNIPVAYAMLATSIGYLLWNGTIPFIVVAQQLGAGTDQFLLLAIPFFFLAGEFMAHGGIIQRLVDLARAMVGHFRGGLGITTVVSSVFFAGISGSAVADLAALGRVEIGMMQGAGYPLGFAAAIKAASSTLGPIIPPSIPMLVYGGLTDTSVGRLFMAGFAPGFLMAVFLIIAVAIVAKRRGFPVNPWQGWSPLAKLVVKSIPVLVLPVIILGGIFGGFFTPTEAAIVAAAYAMVIGLALGELRVASVPGILVRVTIDSARIMFILASATLFSWILARENLPATMASFILSAHTSPWMFLLVVNIVLLFLGAFMEPIPILVIVIPVLMPVVKALGIDPVQFGVMVSLNISLGLIHPPIGMLMFMVMAMTGINMNTFVRETWPFLIALLLALGVITYWPDFVLFLPRHFYG